MFLMYGVNTCEVTEARSEVKHHEYRKIVIAFYPDTFRTSRVKHFKHYIRYIAMTEKMKNRLAVVIGLLFLIYGAVRLGVSSLLLLQLNGVLEFAELQAGLDEVRNFMELAQDKALIPATTFGYLSYLWLMGALLVTGAIGCLTRTNIGKINLYAFLSLYVLLFINFQTINPKVIHLVICALLLALYTYCVKKPGNKLEYE